MPRLKCPICDYPHRAMKWQLDFLVPDGWTLPGHNTVCQCNDCGFVYYDNEATQPDYDRYYSERYGFNGSLDNRVGIERLNELALLAASSVSDKGACIIDFGGGDGHVERRLVEMGYINADTANVGYEFVGQIDLLIMANVLEHIYDLKPTLQGLIDRLKPGGKILIEIPEARGMLQAPMPMLDYHNKHPNHFTAWACDDLFSRFGLRPEWSDTPQCLYQGHALYRALYSADGDPSINIPDSGVYEDSRRRVMATVADRLEKLDQVKEPVIVWGCGDYCLHLFTKVMPKVISFVDLDPAFRGATIKGIPVLDHVTGNTPILVIAQGQQTAILKSINDLGLKNKVIVI
jgi:SAM-dependent methyltransferase